MKDILYEEILKSVGDWIWEVNADGVYTYCSENVYDFLGFHAEEVVGKTPFDFMSEKEGLRVGEIFGAHVAKKEKILQLQNVHIHKNGSYVILETTGIPILDENGDLIGYQGFDRDITEKVEITKHNSAFEVLFEKSFDGILIIENNAFTHCNEKIVEMLKYNSKEELLNTHPSELSPEFQPDGRASFEKAEEMISLAIKNSGHRFEWVHTKADGENFWVEVVLTYISIVDRDIIHVVWRDISERKDMEKKLRILNTNLDRRVKEEIQKNYLQQQKLFQQSRLAQMGEIISMIAHQWRQPLGAISTTSIDLKMQSEFKKFDLKQKEEAQKYETYINNGLTKINELVKSLTHTIDDFRNFYKPNEESNFVSVREPLKKALAIIKPSIESDGIEIVETCVMCDKKAKIYSNEMMRVILNILKNSQDNFKKKSIQYPKITITCECNINYTYLLKIFDNGGGISEDILSKVFDPYFSTKDEKNGPGLGLYISKIIVEEHHNGKLTVENIDDGVCFTIELGIESEKLFRV